MKFLFVPILLLLVCGWLYQANQEKLKEYTAVIKKEKISKVESPKIKIIKQNIFNNSGPPVHMPPPGPGHEINNSLPSITNDDQDNTALQIVNDDQDYSNNFDPDIINTNPLSLDASYANRIQNFHSDIAEMDVGPADIYAPNEEKLPGADLNRAPAEEQSK